MIYQANLEKYQCNQIVIGVITKTIGAIKNNLTK